MSVTILAFDVATVTTGWALLECGGPEIKLKDFGSISCKGTLPERLVQLRTRTLALVEEHKPDHATVEDLKFSSYNKNPAAMVKVAFALGVVIEVLEETGCDDVISIPANSVRKIWDVTQNKAALRRAVNKKFLPQLQQKGRPDGFKKADEDITDAIGLAVAVWVKELKNG